MTDAPDLHKQRLLLLAIAHFVRRHLLAWAERRVNERSTHDLP